jgi:hypothetical protein
VKSKNEKSLLCDANLDPICLTSKLMNEIQFNQFFKEYSLLSHAFDNKIP